MVASPEPLISQVEARVPVRQFSASMALLGDEHEACSAGERSSIRDATNIKLVPACQYAKSRRGRPVLRAAADFLMKIAKKRAQLRVPKMDMSAPRLAFANGETQGECWSTSTDV